MPDKETDIAIPRAIVKLRSRSILAQKGFFNLFRLQVAGLCDLNFFSNLCYDGYHSLNSYSWIKIWQYTLSTQHVQKVHTSPTFEITGTIVTHLVLNFSEILQSK